MNITPIDGVAGGFQCTLEGSPAAEAVEEGLKGLPEGAKYASIVLTDVRFLNSRVINLIVELARLSRAKNWSGVVLACPMNAIRAGRVADCVSAFLIAGRVPHPELAIGQNHSRMINFGRIERAGQSVLENGITVVVFRPPETVLALC